MTPPQLPVRSTPSGPGRDLRLPAVYGAALAAGALTLWHTGPSVAVPQTLGPLHRLLLPRTAGVGHPTHIALTFDDGPDPQSTPRFLELLRQREVTATFFVLGERIRKARSLVAETTAAGHEVAVHGYRHVPLLLRTPGQAADDIRRARDEIADASGQAPRHFRPPHGLASGAALAAARRAGLHTVLWTSWGKDWTSRASAASVLRTVGRTLRPGGTLLLHDSDYASSQGSWRTTLRALPAILDLVEEVGCTAGPLRDHGIGQPRPHLRPRTT